MSKRYDAVIFDLDGTLLNTLEDLTDAVNHALRESGYPERTQEEVRSFVGNGVGMLMRRALPASADGDEEAYQETLQAFKSHYARHNNDTTRPYAGIGAMMEALSAAGVETAVVSNKNDPNVKALTAAHFSRWTSLAIGDQEGARRKPAPDLVLRALDALGCPRARAVYVGDSGVDIETARNAGMDCISVCWGFHAEGELRKAGAAALAHTPDELVRRVLGD